MSNTIPLPEPAYTLPFPDDDELAFSARQMREYAAAVTAAKDAEIERLRETAKALYEGTMRQAAEIAQLRADAIDRQNNVVAPLRAEVAGLREALAQKVVDQTMLTGLTVQDGSLTMGLQGGAAGLLVEMFAQQFKDGGGTNYLQLSFTSSVCLPGEAFIVTVQKCAGKTPHQLRMDAETEAAALRAEVAGLREQVQHLQSLLVDADNICKEHGGCDLQDCIDNDGDLYQSQAMVDALDAARKGEA